MYIMYDRYININAKKNMYFADDHTIFASKYINDQQKRSLPKHFHKCCLNIRAFNLNLFLLLLLFFFFFVFFYFVTFGIFIFFFNQGQSI